MLRIVFRSTILFLLFATLSWGTGRATEAKVGQAPPPFALTDEGGETHRLKDLLGRPVVLYFTHNMCHYCTQIIGYLKRAHGAYEARGLTIVTINVMAGDVRLIRRYKEQFSLPFPMLAGKDPQLLRDYEVNYVPIVVFIGRDGRIRRIYHHFILEQDFEASVKEIVEGG